MKNISNNINNSRSDKMKNKGKYMESVVISLGGSVINPGKPDTKKILSLANIFNSFKGKMAITTGGGSYARIYADCIREISKNEFFADEIGILETRQNAMLVIPALKNACPYVVQDFREAISLLNTYNIVVMGGFMPGITTDAVAVMLAEVIKAKRLVNISNINGIYDRPPNEKGAKKLDKLSLQELLELAYEYDKRKAGTHFIFDVLACKLALRAGIEIHFVSSEEEEVRNALNGRKHNGSIAYA
ncbi:MAG: UMP kinase [Candidatus Anstonellales archaeon]